VHPTLFEFRVPLLGKDVRIESYGTAIVLAFLLAAWWTTRRAVRDLGLSSEAGAKVRPPDRVFNAAFAMLFLGLLGARLVYAFANYAKFQARPMSFLYVWEGGLVGYGGVVAALLWLAWWLPRQAEPGKWLTGKGFALLDLFARGACLAFALGWVAPLLAGDDFGKPTQAAWGFPVTWFADGTQVVSHARVEGWDVLGTKLHPVQVYESLLALGLFVVLAVMASRRPVPGRVAAAFLVLHAVGHAGLDLLRGDGDARGMLVPGALSWSQFLAIPVGFAGVAIWLIRRPTRTHATTREPAHAP
jgi:phosphatidylglycerol:prolipoprotein diacylglycerol transferase